MSELEDRIGSILNSPEELRRITELAQSLMGGAASPAGTSGENGLPDQLREMLCAGDGEKNNELALLEAMKPFLGEKRRKKMSRALQLARAAKIAGRMLGSEGGEDDH